VLLWLNFGQEKKIVNGILVTNDLNQHRSFDNRTKHQIRVFVKLSLWVRDREREVSSRKEREEEEEEED
jgi:hypothetical protein